jgi:beta-glucosidase/6-phospho-beta-glucosidase/beta-galactosidase
MFRSFFMGGFECASHRRQDGKRLDLLAATRHDKLARSDYQQLARHGIKTVRDGLRWHQIERMPRYYNWAGFLPMLQAANESGTEVIWDLCHYGWPDGLDIWTPAFVDRFTQFAAAAAQLVVRETGRSGWYCPVNEISFWAWDGGQMGGMNPRTKGRGGELKRQLLRAAIGATAAIREVDPGARFVVSEPLIHITTGSEHPDHIVEAESARLFQFETVDILTGRAEPQLGGQPGFLDAVGANFYPHNQWYHFGPPIPFGHHHFRPLSEMLQEQHSRFGLPVFISETGAEGSARASWIHYVCSEIAIARDNGVPVTGVCIYPITAFPGWDNDRHCQVGLLGLPDQHGQREVYQPLASELALQSQWLAPPARGPVEDEDCDVRARL